jgi:hypothetical protein
MDGSGIGDNIQASQDFESAYDVYDIVVADNFTGDGDNINMVEMVLGGWNGFSDPSSVTGYNVNTYTNADAAGADLIGDISSQYIDAADAIMSSDWTGANFLMVFDTTLGSVAGEQLIGVQPANDFATGGQTGCATTLLGDGGGGIQANPGGGFGFGPWQAAEDSAYRVSGGAPADPCSFPLPTNCTADVDGDMMVAVGDVLAVIGTMGECGDGTYRPAGDVAPLPNGDCCVDVSDILAVIGAWGEDCTPRGACCSEAGDCTDDMTQSDCESSGGNYEGDDTSCVDIVCATPYSGCPDGADTDCDDCWEDGDDSTTDCNAGVNGDGSMDPLTIGVPLCGESSVFVDISGDTYRDTDWFESSELNAGGSFVLTCESETGALIFGIVDLDLVEFVEYVVVPAGQIYTHEFAPVAPGNYSFWVGASEWNTDWSCANGADYWMQLDAGAAASGACCVNEVCVGENSMSECDALNGEWHFDETCADVNNCLPIIGACCMGVNECLDGLSEDDCGVFGGNFMGANTSCAKIDCADMPCQFAHGVDDAWSAGTSTDDPSSGVYYNRADFVNADSMSGFTAWGLQLYYSGSWASCSTDFDFNIRSYDDDGTNKPGTMTAEALDVPASKIATGELFAGVYELMEWNMDFTATNVEWLAAQSASDGINCWFLWMSSGTGDGMSAIDSGSGWTNDYAYDLAVCVE